ncbi:hypothetical protein VN97_g5422 [Penicillium thymicola]|uniref:Uncharacterized protein n=1 Tax=Penicillium thymicola TaxID=293382 RepID=A0AAI9X8Q0_PENTH|nr:hypothetical protein VN97_g5422 [Penicillium thymicola]
MQVLCSLCEFNVPHRALDPNPTIQKLPSMSMLVYSGITSNAKEVYSIFGTAQAHLQYYRHKDNVDVFVITHIGRVIGNWIPKLCANIS